MEQDSGKKEGIALRGFLRVTFLSLKSPQTHLQSTNSPWNRAGVTLVLVGVVEQGDKKGRLELTTFGLSSAVKFSVLRSVQGREISCNQFQ